MADALFGAGTPPVVPADFSGELEADIVIVGAGIGGGTLAWALRKSGARVLLIEKGDFLPRERENWSPYEVNVLKRYRNSTPWTDDLTGESFVPHSYHYVGGASKMYGAALQRLREADFDELALQDGLSPAWPVHYADFEPFYARAEKLYRVHGSDADPTNPPRSTRFPFPAIRHEPAVGRMVENFVEQGLRPTLLPQAVDYRPGGDCVLCRTCDGYPCLVDAKGDADVSAVRPALNSPTVRLLTNTDVRRVHTDSSGRLVTGIEVLRGGRVQNVRAEKYVLAAGAINTAALLLRSAPGGVANSSDQVGRNFMTHVSSAVSGSRLGKAHHTHFQKTFALNDWYFAGPDNEFPLGHIQGIGKLQAATIKSARPWVPDAVLDFITDRSVEAFVVTEDVPLADNRILVNPDGSPRLRWRPTNVKPHKELVRRLSRAMRGAGYPFIFAEQFGIQATLAHQCGTARMGEDPKTSVLTPDCRTHDVENLWVVDASFFVSAAAVGPALTIAANALRVAAAGELVPAADVVSARLTA